MMSSNHLRDLICFWLLSGKWCYFKHHKKRVVKEEQDISKRVIRCKETQIKVMFGFIYQVWLMWVCILSLVDLVI